MKTNQYDNEVFFKKYEEMTRSKLGLNGAGEWPQLQKMLPDFKGKTVLDLGCGYGWHAQYACEHGAKAVTALDNSKKMLEKAKTLHHDLRITYVNQAMEEFEAEAQTYDIIISSLALHYVEDYVWMVKQMKKWLKQDGILVCSFEHPIFTAHGSQNWIYDEHGKIAHFPIDHYFEEGKRNTCFLDEPVVKYHRTLTTYLNTLLQCGFILEEVIEPTPPKHLMHLAEMKEELRRPMMLLVRARKNA